MVYSSKIGKYHLGRTIGQGTFAKVKIAINTENGRRVAVKIIEKQMIMENKLMHQVKREIWTMQLLRHPNIIRIYEVIATKKKIYLVMEYVSGGQLSEKLSWVKSFNEGEARKYFQQLIDAVEYCHARGVYHRDLKPENLLLDSKGNLKVSDFGLSALHKPGSLLSTACGSPSYVAPEVIAHKNYDGAIADVWSCGVILFELLAGYLPFDDRNLMNLYRKISKSEYKCPDWFTTSVKDLISRILDPWPRTRISIAEILEDEWFRLDYKPSIESACEELFPIEHNDYLLKHKDGSNEQKSPNFINAFKLIAMSNDLDLSGLFETQDASTQRTKMGSKHSIDETIEKIELAAKNFSLSVARMNSSKIKLYKINRSCKSCISLSAEVIEVTPNHCVVEIYKPLGEFRVYKEFCGSLSRLLERQTSFSESQLPSSLALDETDGSTFGSFQDDRSNHGSKDLHRGYSSS